MKQKLVTLFVVLSAFFHATVTAQIDIPIGTGTAGNTNTSYPAPLQDYWEGSRAQYLYTAAELTAAGMAPGNVVAIKFDVQALATSINTLFALEQYTINIGTTSSASLSATTWESGTTVVYGPVDYNVTLGINTFTFTSPFLWNGTDNIVIDICNGDPLNGTPLLTTYTGNAVVPWTTGLSFNGSHTYIADDAGNLCGTINTASTGTQTTRPNIIFSWIAGTACSGTPAGGTAASSITNITCPGTSFNLSVTGSTVASGLSYQWQSAAASGGPWTNIANATSASLTTTQSETLKFYRRVITCGAASNTSTVVQVTSVAGISYLTLPVSESFENTWINVCDTRDVPNLSWKNTPVSGNTSWRREDDPAGGAWTSPTLGAYTPPASVGLHSARWHSYDASFGTSGSFDVYINCNTADASKRLFFDYINTSGTDSLSVLISTNGGISFTRLDSAGVAAAWRTKTILFSTLSATTVIRFRATGDFGTTDIGIDNIKIADFGPCTGAPVGGTTTSSASPVCLGVAFLLDVTGSTDASGLTYQWQSSPDGTTWANIAGATQATLNRVQTAATWYRRTVTCTNAGGSATNSTALLVGIVPVQYTTLPVNESFESTWLSKCGLREIPNAFWGNIPVTGNTSWRRNDDAVAGAWLNPTLGTYTPTASAGVSSARFHTYATPNGATGSLDLYVDANTASPTKRLLYDFINTTGNDSLTILLSTDGGISFTRLDSARLSTVWRTKTVVFTSTSATTVIRFRGTSDATFTDIGLDNIRIADFPPCTGAPAGGTAITSATPVCVGTSFTLNVTGSTDASGLTYQWQSSADNVTYTNITGATAVTLIRTQTAATWYRLVVTCGSTGGSSANSTAVLVGFAAPAYAPMPALEDFENTWVNICDIRDVPNNFWRNTPVTGNNSWRREDDAVAAAWVNPTLGTYNPPASTGSHSARFHSYQSALGTTGSLDFYVNCGTSAINRLTFDYINTSGGDSLTVLVSTNGGATFVRLDSTLISTVWRTKTIVFNSSSATTVVRFRATSDFGTTDIGIDNIRIGNFALCTGTPVPGTTTANVTGVVCIATPFILSVAGATDASGLVYQWQSSPDSITWSNIPNANLETLTTTQTASTYYRRVIICTNGSATAPSAGIRIISPLAVSGTFTINSAGTTALPNFQTFAAAYNYIKCGINGPVVFNVLNGTTGNYNEQLIMTAVPGASATNTVTFKGNGTASIGFASTNINERAVIKLIGASNIIFDSLVINANTGTYGYGVQLLNNSDFNTVRNCIINSSVTDATQNFGGVIINGVANSITTTSNTALNDDNIITGNTITGGFAGVAMVAATAGANGNNTISRNKILDFYQYGIYVAGSYFATIESDSIARPTRTTSAEISGIYFTGISTDAFVSKNKITNPFGGQLTGTTAFNGINFSFNDATSAAPNIVSNNLIYNINGLGAITGIANTSSDNVQYLHNTISLDNTASTGTATTRGFFQTTVAGGIFFFNNLITISNGGTGAKHCIYLATPTTGFLANNNNYVNNAAAGTNFIGFFNTNQPTLTAWKSATRQDANSISRLPFYNNPAAGDYAPTNGGVDNLGRYVDVPVDIRYVNRNFNNPDIGAYEFTAPGCVQPVVPGNTIFEDTTVCQNVPVLLNLTIGAWGSNQTFQWQSATSATGPFTAVGTPRPYPDTTITSTVSLFYRCEVTCGGSTLYSNPVFLQVTPSLPTGTYTINKTLPTNYPATGVNFASFNDAKAAMGCGIIGGAVVFNVVSGTGPYTEQLKLDSIAGTSPVNTITFNGNGNTISFASTNTNERAVIKLNAADYLIFDSLTINAAGGTFGYGVQLINKADSNIFRKCTIISSITATTTNFAGIVINATDAGPVATGNTLCDFNRFDRDSIVGGYYGATVVGIAAFPVIDNQFTNSTFRDYYSTGIYVAGTRNTLIEGNVFTRPNITIAANPIYSIHATAVVSNGLKVSKNRFTKPFTAAPASTTPWFGVYHNAVDATAGSENIISNNLFYDLDGNGALNPLYNNGSDNVRYYHNTISLDNIASTSAAVTQGFYQTTAAIGVEFFNNIISIKRGGTGAKHAIYLATAASEVESDYNDFYVKAGGTNNHVGFFTTNQTTLAAWQAASNDDDSSLSIDPTFINPAAGDFRPGLLPLDNKGTQKGIGTDILNVSRGPRPDMGAFEFAPPVCTSPPIAGVASVTPASGICLEAPIRLSLVGNSPIGTLTFLWQHAPTATGPWTNLSPLQYTPDYDTVTTVNTFYRCIVTCNGNSVISNTVSVTLASVPMAGTYTINPAGTGARNFTTFVSAVAALQCGIADRVVFDVAPVTFTEQVRIPYVPGTSASKTVTFRTDPLVAGTATLTAAATATLNYTLRLDSANNFIIRNLAITGTNPAFGRVVELTGVSFSDSILNCVITAPVTTSAANTTAGLYAAAFRGRNIVIKGNTISNGANGINYAGTSATVLGNTVTIDSNRVSGSYSHGIFTQFISRIRLRGNTVSMGAPQAANSSGFYMNYCDTAFRLTGNTVNINSSTAGAYGVNILNSRALFTDSSIIASNRVIADTGNTGALYGIGITLSKGINMLNNVISLNSTASTTVAPVYGIYHLTNTDAINYYNNSINIRGASVSGYAGYFNQALKAAFNVRNNVFANPGGGKALFVSNPSNFVADYNMLHSTGALLAQTSTGTQTTFVDFKAWTNAWNWDRYSISYPPAFVSSTDLRPNVANPDVWAMHGRGTQIRYNTYDFNNNYRPDSLRAGVPDLGAYEFFPSAQPTILLATPANPVPNATQTFSYGTDTVMKITWGATAPPSLQVRRFSGVVPTGLLPATDSMYFYTQVTIPGGGNYPYSAKLYYINPWQGSIPSQNVIGMGRTTPSNAWVVGANSRVNVARKEITQDAIVYLDRFTGLVNPFAQIENEDSSSNRGKDFWVGYQKSYDFTATGGSQEMVVYMGSATQDAHVTITIEGTTGTPWIRNYTVPAGSALSSELIPKTGINDARLTAEGKFDKKGIHIVSDVPIVAYAHIYSGANSGATMLMPTSVWGYEYYTLSTRQNYPGSASGPSASAFFIVAKDDSTWVEINPSNPTSIGWVANGGTQPNGNYLVKLNKGDAYQVLGAVLSGSEGYDLTGSYVKSIANAQGTCSPIAVFAGSTRTYIACNGGATGNGGDLIIQQVFPSQAWGSKYLTAPTSNSAGPTATSNMTNPYRVLVKDPTTVVRRNGIILTNLINGRYYQFDSNTADYIESNKPVLLAQYISSSGSVCANTGTNGDPEMFYISPVQQAIKSTQFYLNDVDNIADNFITLIIPTEGLATLKIDGIGYNAIPTALKYDYAHPNLAGYTVVTKKYVPATSTAGTVESDQAFTGIIYGLGSVESYGYNLGTLVKNLNNASSVNNDLNVGPNATGYTCRNSPFKLKVLLPIKPDSIFWQISALAPRLTPGANVMQTNPVLVDSSDINGITYYGYVLNTTYTIDTAGIFFVPIQFYSNTIEKCDKKQDGRAVIQVLPAPVTDFRIGYPNTGTAGCTGDVLNFTGDLITQNGIALNQWQWRFTNGTTTTTPTGQNQTFTYPNAGTYDVSLRGITADGCISDTVKRVTINPRPVVAVVADSIGVCPNGPVTFTVASPATGAVYRWYSAPTGGTPLFTGTTYTPTVATLPASFYAEATSAVGCVSVDRKRVTAYQLPLLSASVVTQTAATANSVTFTWTAIAGAINYSVSLDNGVTYIIPSSGLNGLTHTVNGLATLSSANIIVRANGANVCQSSSSISISGCTNSIAQVVPDSLAVCRDSAVTFTVTPIEPGISYTWYNTATGGTALFTGTSYTVPGIAATSTYYVQQTRTTSGCTSTSRKRVVVTVLAPLVPTVAIVDTVSVNSVRFRWNAVPGAGTYEVSVAGGPWITPSSGATGLTHTVTNLRPLDTVSIRVRAIGAITCQTSISAAVTGRTRPDQIYIPNTFTPNGDGLNDILQVYGYTINSLTFTVFNQWGQKIYESNQQARAWDGTYKGQQQPVGVYVYICRIVLLNGTVETRKGSINLVR